jgi:hypothetical protein
MAAPATPPMASKLAAWRAWARCVDARAATHLCIGVIRVCFILCVCVLSCVCVCVCVRTCLCVYVHVFGTFLMCSCVYMFCTVFDFSLAGCILADKVKNLEEEGKKGEGKDRLSCCIILLTGLPQPVQAGTNR